MKTQKRIDILKRCGWDVDYFYRPINKLDLIESRYEGREYEYVIHNYGGVRKNRESFTRGKHTENIEGELTARQFENLVKKYSK